jgi:hypothetical protein
MASIRRRNTCLISRRARFGSSAVAMAIAASSRAPISTWAMARTFSMVDRPDRLADLMSAIAVRAER